MYNYKYLYILIDLSCSFLLLCKACAGCEGCESCEGCEGCEGCEHCKGLLALGVDDIMDIPMPIPTPYEIYYRQVNGGYVPIERNPYHAQNIDRYRELAALWEQHKEKLLQKKLRQMKLQQQKLEQQKLEQQKLEQEKIEQQKLEQQKLEQQRLEQQKLEEEKLQLEQLQQEQLQQEQWQQQLPPYTTQSGLTIYQCDVFNQPISNLGPMFAFYIAQHPKPDLPKWNSYLNPEPYVGKPAIASRPIGKWYLYYFNIFFYIKSFCLNGNEDIFGINPPPPLSNHANNVATDDW